MFSFEWQSLIPPIATLLAAFAGAWFAFLLQDKKHKREERKKQRAAVSKAIFTISRLWNMLVQYQREIVEPIRQVATPWLHMQATIEHQFQNESFDADDLLFLLDTDHANFLSQLLLEESRCSIVLGLIAERSNLVLERLHPMMEKLGYDRGDEVRLKELEDQLGPDLTNKLKESHGRNYSSHRRRRRVSGEAIQRTPRGHDYSFRG